MIYNNINKKIKSKDNKIDKLMFSLIVNLFLIYKINKNYKVKN